MSPVAVTFFAAVITVMLVLLWYIIVALTPTITTLLTSEPFPRFIPNIVTMSPPDGDPKFGLTDVMMGAPLYVNVDRSCVLPYDVELIDNTTEPADDDAVGGN